MANALGCRLGRSVIRGLGIHSGTLYPVSDGAMSYRNIMTSHRPQMTLEYDTVSTVFLHSPTQVGPMGCNLVPHEDPGISTPVKAACARNAGFGAAIIWTHLPAEPAGQHDPLLQAIREHYLQ